MDLGIPPLNIQNLRESNPLKSRFSAREVAQHLWLLGKGSAWVV